MDHTITMNSLTGVAEAGMTQTDYPLLNKVYLSLEVPLGTFIGDTSFGSRLYLLKRVKETERTRRLAEDYSKDALKWLTDESKAKSIEVSSEWLTKGNRKRLAIYVDVTPPDSSKPVSYTTFIDVV